MLVSKTLAAKVGTVVAVAGVAVGSVAATADAATAHKVKVPTQLTATVGPTHINGKHPFGEAKIKGQLTEPGLNPAPQITGAKILLEREGTNGKWHVVQHAKTGRHGYVRFFVHHVAKGATFELVFAGNKNFAPSVSNVIVISAS
jgi:hypothetical protein